MRPVSDSEPVEERGENGGEPNIWFHMEELQTDHKC